MKLLKIEILCEPFYNSIDPKAALLPVGKYKLFFSGGSSHIQNYITKSDLKEAKHINKVLEFKYEN